MISRKGVTFTVVALLIMSLIAAFLLRDLIWVRIEMRSLLVADEAELRSTYDRWMEAGKPVGRELASFMAGRNPRILATNVSVNLNGTNFQSVFAMINLSSDQADILLITTSKSLIRQQTNGNFSLVSYPY